MCALVTSVSGNPGRESPHDAELRRVGQLDEQGPIDPAYIPHGLPASHWWWHYPEQFK